MKNKIKSSALLVFILIISLFVAGGRATPVYAKHNKKNKKQKYHLSISKNHYKKTKASEKVVKVSEVKSKLPAPTSTTSNATSITTSSAKEIIKQFTTNTPSAAVTPEVKPTTVAVVSPVPAAPTPIIITPTPAPAVIAETTAPTAVTTTAPSPTVVSPTAKPTLKNVQAMWVWGESYGIVTDSKKQSDFFSFIKAPHGNSATAINRIYLNGDSFDYKSNSNKTALRAFLKRAHQNGVAVEYLTGNSKWAIPGNEKEALSRADKMIAFNKETSDTQERYDGLHLDIEPYLLDDWSKNAGSGKDKYNDAIQTSYLNILADAKTKLKNHDDRLTLSADIPTWFSKVTDIWPNITSNSSPLDYITFMNYFDKESTFLYGYDGANKVGGIGPNLEKGGNIPMVFGAETIHLDPTSITFYEEGFGTLAKVFSKAKEVYGTNSHFAGTAIHHYRTLVELKD